MIERDAVACTRVAAKRRSAACDPQRSVRWCSSYWNASVVRASDSCFSTARYRCPCYMAPICAFVYGVIEVKGASRSEVAMIRAITERRRRVG